MSRLITVRCIDNAPRKDLQIGREYQATDLRDGWWRVYLRNYILLVTDQMFYNSFTKIKNDSYGKD